MIAYQEPSISHPLEAELIGGPGDGERVPYTNDAHIRYFLERRKADAPIRVVLYEPTGEHTAEGRLKVAPCDCSVRTVQYDGL